VAAAMDVYGSMASALPVYGAGLPAHPTYNRPQYGGRVEGQWAPIYGKLSLAAEAVLHFDTYIAAGVGFVAPNQSDTTMAANLAIGQHYFINRWVALRLEVREQIFAWARNPATDAQTHWQGFLSASVGACFFFPLDQAEDAVSAAK
jgi:outer membrane beta-barrel protein